MKSLLAIALAMTGLACSGHYAQTMRPVHQLAREGKPSDAYAALVQQTKGTDWDALLVALDEGALLHRAGEWERSAEALNRAIAIANDRETVSVSDELFGRAPFRMANHEKQALHALQAINYLQLGKLDDALVEARLTDLRQTKLASEVDASRATETFVIGNTVDEQQRAFFEQLIFGRFISGVAWELEGKPDEAFIDYYQAYLLASHAPPDARVHSQVFTPRLRSLGKQLGRKEEVVFASAAGEVEPPPGKDGELIVIVESGFAPELVLKDNNGGYAFVPVPRSTAPGYFVVKGEPFVPAPVSSIEELVTRRGYSGVVIDRERSASVGVNTVLFLSYVVLFPVAMPLIIKRAYESGIRMGQSWLMLPAEFQVARVRLPAGRHSVMLPSLTGFQQREVEIVPGKPTIVVTQGP